MSLEGLPQEILDAICKALCPHCQSEPDQEGPDADDIVESVRRERECIKALASLSLVSRKLSNSASPILYHRPLTSGVSGYRSLMRTVMTSSELGQHVRSLVLADYDNPRPRRTYQEFPSDWDPDDGWQPDVHATACVVFPWIRDLWSSIDFSTTPYSPLGMSDIDDEGHYIDRYRGKDLAQYAMSLAQYAIMCHTPNVEALCVQVHDLDLLVPVKGGLSGVKQLAISATDVPWGRRSYPWSWPDLLPKLVMISEQFQNLRTLELWDVRLDISRYLLSRNKHSAFSRLKELRLRDCLIDETFLEWILRECNLLEHFEVRLLFVPGYAYEGWNSDMNGINMQDFMVMLGAAPMQRTLEKLHLTLPDSNHTFAMLPKLSFEAFTKLREFHFACLEEGVRHGLPSVCRMLERMPPSLEILCLVDFAAEIRYSSRLVNTTEKGIAARFPRLRQIVMRDAGIRTPRRWELRVSGFARVGIDVRLERSCPHLTSSEPTAWLLSLERP